MKKNLKLLLILLVCVLAFAACQNNVDPCANGHNYVDGKCTVCGAADPDYVAEKVDYVSQLTLDTSSGTKQLDVTVKNYVDGDTTHFYANDSSFDGGVLKARYLAIDTPESTGKIEAYGKKASNFTKSKLQSAAAIRVESDNASWNSDSTGSRYMVWVWYKTSADGAWRNLNLEILQEGLAIASNTANNRYGEICVKALNQAKSLKLNVFSGKKDPDMYYGDAVELTLRELRTNISAYNGIKVAFEGVVVLDTGDKSVYVQELDEESGEYSGIYVYYGYDALNKIREALSIGNRVRVVGTCQYYETGGTYQISGLSYRLMNDDDPSNTKIIEEGTAADVVYTEITAEDLVSRMVTVEVASVDENGEEVVKNVEMRYAELIYNTAVEIKNVTVTKTHTTTDEASSSKGAITLTCTADGKTFTVRTIVLKDSEKNTVTADYFDGKTFDFKGVVESYNGEYQIKLFSLSAATEVK